MLLAIPFNANHCAMLLGKQLRQIPKDIIRGQYVSAWKTSWTRTTALMPFSVMSNTLLNPHRQPMEVDTEHYCMDMLSSCGTLSVEW